MTPLPNQTFERLLRQSDRVPALLHSLRVIEKLCLANPGIITSAAAAIATDALNYYFEDHHD